MTYDPASGRIIVFGGYNGTAHLNDTWTFNGVGWTQIAAQSPPPARANAQMAYDSVSHMVVLFGGFDGYFSQSGLPGVTGTVEAEMCVLSDKVYRNQAGRLFSSNNSRWRLAIPSGSRSADRAARGWKELGMLAEPEN